MTSRDAMLDAVRANLPAGVHALPVLPPAGAAGADEVAAFAASLARMGGRAAVCDGGDMFASVRDLLTPPAVVCSMVSEYPAGMVADADDAAALATIDVSIVRAVCGVAATGSVLLTEAELGVSAIAYLAQHLVVLLDPADIVADLAAAYGHAVFARARYAVFHTGPSATADIEGVLIRGAQGVRSLTVLLSRRR